MASFRPSSTLQRAARKDLERLERTRQRLLDRRSDLKAEIDRLDAELGELDDRETALAQVLDKDSAPAQRSEPAREVLKGAAIRERAAAIFYATFGSGKTEH